jgi:transposase-like protein
MERRSGHQAKKLVLLLPVDLGTQDIVDAWLAQHEDYQSIRPFVREIKKAIGYEPNLAVIDLDQAWNEAVSDVFPDVPIQYCVVRFERMFDREIPLRNRTEEQCELKSLVRKMLYAPNLAEAREALEEILFSRQMRYFRDKKSLKMIRSLQSNFDLLTTHFRVHNSYRSNNITDGVNNLVQMRLNLIRGYKKKQSAWNSLKLILMYYRFNLFESCKDNRKNGKCPLNLAGVDTSKMDWVAHSQKDRSVLDRL